MTPTITDSRLLGAQAVAARFDRFQDRFCDVMRRARNRLTLKGSTEDEQFIAP